MKRLAAVVLAVLAFGLVGCSSGDDSGTTPTPAVAWAFENVTFEVDSIDYTWINGTVRNISGSTAKLSTVTIKVTYSDNTFVQVKDYIYLDIAPGLGTSFKTFVDTGKKTVTAWDFSAQ